MARKSISNKTVKSIVERDGSANCTYCRRFGASRLFTGSKGKGAWLWIEHEIDHVIPLSRGGTDELPNLVITCRNCNRRKNNKLGWVYGT
ncbi:hypothetical protein SD71_16005 [Cohnella kolymensis]|uniref:HNH nuclease domain-containing protein n=1 Tax=Cohnella kolymensis TaxID=1590652 RepID=A0ABR5A2B4_9BACL|nr:HNH endonuclease signature motif containing protein [Cohnella kolymensis]KIL35136.1 hypothetical protein SD71_16005 [Cohnella kolymensis]